MIQKNILLKKEEKNFHIYFKTIIFFRFIEHHLFQLFFNRRGLIDGTVSKLNFHMVGAT